MPCDERFVTTNSMASFIVRVELHGALTEATYTRLHNSMAAVGFSRTIVANDGHSYWLPTAMYTANSVGTAESVRIAASNAASATGLPATIFVANMTDWSSSALTPYK